MWRKVFMDRLLDSTLDLWLACADVVTDITSIWDDGLLYQAGMRWNVGQRCLPALYCRF